MKHKSLKEVRVNISVLRERSEEDVVIVTVVLHNYRLTLFFYLLSPTLPTLVDLILSLLSQDLYLILPITSHSLSHIPYLSPQENIDIFYGMSYDKRVSTHRKEDNLPRPDRRRSEFRPTHPATPESPPQ